jgi:hypothetical protein
MSGRAWRNLAITLVVLIALLVAADRIGVVIGERVAGDTIKSSQDLPSRPDVDVAGFPFLTQFATGKYDKVTVTAHGVPIARTKLILSRVRVVLRKLTLSRDFSSVFAKTATATALLAYDQLSRALGATVGYDSGGRVKVTEKISIAGRTVTGTLRTRPQVVNGALGFTGSTVTNAGSIGQAVVTALEQVVNLHIPLGGIPFKVRVQSLHVDPTGVVIALVGHDVSYTS